MSRGRHKGASEAEPGAIWTVEVELEPSDGGNDGVVEYHALIAFKGDHENFIARTTDGSKLVFGWASVRKIMVMRAKDPLTSTE